jgi:hypothetical protein
LIDEEKLDSFNMPFYGPSAEELQNIVEMENSFEIESVRFISGFHLHPLLEVREKTNRFRFLERKEFYFFFLKE